MIWFLPSGEAAEREAQLERWLPLLPETRREKALACRHQRDRWNSAAAFMLLAYALRAEYGLTPDFAMTYGPYGKPCFAHRGLPHFNLSHCGAGVACILNAGGEVGVDVQQTFFPGERFALRFLTEADRELIARTASPDVMFAKIWTLKESWLKAKGLSVGMIREVGPAREANGHLTISQDGCTAVDVLERPDCCLSAAFLSPGTPEDIRLNLIDDIQ